MIRSKPRPEGPFPPVNDLPHRQRIADALVADPRVDLDSVAAAALAAQTTTRAADLVQRTGTIRDVRFREYKLADGEWVRTLRLATTFDLPWWHNTRIETRWGGPDAPARPWPTVRGGEEPVATLSTRCADYTAAVELVRKANAYVVTESSDRKRGYSLHDDMAANGQENAGIAVLHELCWPDPASGGTARRFLLGRVLGNSRAAVRLQLLNLDPVDAAFGVPLRLLRGALAGSERASELVDGAPAVIADPAEAWNRLMAAYELAWEVDHGTATLPDGFERLANLDLVAIERMAMVETEVVVAVSDPPRLLELVQKANIRDHLRGNQDLDQEARLIALGAEILDAHRRAGRITADEATMLYGATAPATIWPGDLPEVAETKRRVRLLELIFPTSDAATRAVGAVMGEPTKRNAVTVVQIQQRARVFTALATRGQHNARAGEAIYSRSQGQVGVSFPEGDLDVWLHDAMLNPHSAAADALLGPLAITWLMEARFFGAPRGSDPKGRRSAKDVLGALRADRARAVGLVNELIRAAAAGDAPRQVDADGFPLNDTVADRSWFDEVFPPSSRRATDSESSSPPAAGPPPTPAEQLKAAQDKLTRKIADIAGGATGLTEIVDEIVGLCDDEALTLDEAWVREVVAAKDDMVDDLEGRPGYRRLRQRVGA